MASAAHEAFSALNCTNLLQHLSCLCCKAYPMILMLHMSRLYSGCHGCCRTMLHAVSRLFAGSLLLRRTSIVDKDEKAQAERAGLAKVG